jgi:hypothetical protein
MRAIATALAVGIAVGGCAPDAGPVKEWSPKDHDHDDASRSPMGQVRQRKPVDDEPELVDLAWEKNCSRCHGPSGHGDGPMGPSVHAPDLTRDDFLSKTSDEDVAAIIRNGRGQMPAFNSLPERVVSGLVKRLRSRGHDE